MRKPLLYTTLVLLSSCSTIDDNLDDCGTSFELDYELRLVTNMNTELRTELQTELSTEVNVANALRAHLGNIFTDYAHDVDLSFYDTQGDSARLQHDEHVMDANQASYALYLPMRQYMHLAVANVVDNPIVSLTDDTLCHTAQLSLAKEAAIPSQQQQQPDTINSHTTGIFTARQHMEVLSGIDQTFNVHLYMVNCAASLVVDTLGSGIRDLQVYTTGFATGFNIADSTFVFGQTSPIVRTERISNDQEGGLMAFCSVTFPSQETPAPGAQNISARSRKGTRTIIDTDEPFISSDATDALWELHVYATTADGSITESKLYVLKPLRAGQLKVIKARVRPNGEVESHDHTVGVSVVLNWNNGGQYNPEL